MEKAQGTRENHDHAGFSLIELLIVIVILGVLAAVVVFAVAQTTQDSSRSACATEAKTFATAVQAFRTSPAHLNVLPQGGTVDDVAGALFQANLLSTPQVKYGVTGAPTSDHWGFVPASGVVTPDPATCTP